MREQTKSNIQNMVLKGILPRIILDRLENGQCPFCGDEPTDFKDTESLREYAISGLCQRCQDLTFDDIFPTS